MAAPLAIARFLHFSAASWLQWLLASSFEIHPNERLDHAAPPTTCLPNDVAFVYDRHAPNCCLEVELEENPNRDRIHVASADCLST
jgi:hypothetical protein